MFGNNDNPMFSGAMKALQLAQGMQNFEQDREMFRRQMLRQKVFDTIQQADAMHRIMGFSRPVEEGGTVTYGVDSPKEIRPTGSMGALLDGMQSTATASPNRLGWAPAMTMHRQADSGRTMNVGGLTGAAKRIVEMMTPEELQQRDLGFRRQAANVDIGAYATKQAINNASMLQRQKELAVFQNSLNQPRPERPQPPRQPTTVGAPKEIKRKDGTRVLRTFFNDGTYRDDSFDGEYVPQPGKERPASDLSGLSASERWRISRQDRLDKEKREREDRERERQHKERESQNQKILGQMKELHEKRRKLGSSKMKPVERERQLESLQSELDALEAKRKGIWGAAQSAAPSGVVTSNTAPGKVIGRFDPRTGKFVK